jgi:septum formation protein
MGQPELVLASTSPYRKELLARLRLPFTAVSPAFTEVSPPEPVTPDEVRAAVLENARGKALSLGRHRPQAVILASDQLGECLGRLLRKPGTLERALEQLRFLSGKEHRLHTAVVLYQAAGEVLRTEVITSTLRIRPLPEEELRRYLEKERPLDCAGSYISEGLGIALFEYLRGDDPTAIIGLPLLATCRLLEEAGLSPLGGEAT